MKFKNLMGTFCLLSTFSMEAEAATTKSIWAPIVMGDALVMFVAVEVKIVYGIDAIMAYAENSSNRTPMVADYTKAGILNVDSRNISQINSIIRQKSKNEVNTKAKIQMIVNNAQHEISIEKILEYASNRSQAKPTFDDYKRAGISCLRQSRVQEVNSKIRASQSVESLFGVQSIVNGVENVVPLILDNDAFDPDWVIMLSATIGLDASCEADLLGVLLTGRDINRKQGKLYSSILHYYKKKEISIGLNYQQTMRSYSIDATTEVPRHIDYKGTASNIDQFASDQCTDYNTCWGRLESTWMMCYILEHSEEKLTWVIGGHLHNIANLLRETNVCNGKELISRKVKEIVISSGWSDRTSAKPEMNLSEGRRSVTSASEASRYLFQNRPTNVPIVIATVPNSGMLNARVGDIYRRNEFANTPMAFIMSVPRYGVYGDHGLSDTEALLYAVRDIRASNGSVYKSKIKTCFHINSYGAVKIGSDCGKEDYYLEKRTSDYVKILDSEVYNLINRVMP